MISRSYADFSWSQAADLLAIDSPSGFTHHVAAYLQAVFASLGFPVTITKKGGVLADLGGADDENGLMLAAHVLW